MASSDGITGSLLQRCLNHEKPASKGGFHSHAASKNVSATLDGGTETLVEALDTATRGRLLLLAGIEGMAVGANVDGEILVSGSAHLVGGAAGTGRSDLLVIRMDTFFHREAS